MNIYDSDFFKYQDTDSDYLGVRSPITYPNQRFERPLEAILPSHRGKTSGRNWNLGFPAKERMHDPAFGELTQYDKWDTSYPGSFEKLGWYNEERQIPRLQQDDFYENFRDQADVSTEADVPTELIKSPILAEEEITDVENLVNPDFNFDFLEKEYPTDLPYDELDDLEAQNVIPTFETSEEQEEYLERVRNMSTIQDQGIPAADKWRNFLSKVTRQPYRPAMGGVTMGSGKTYSPAQLNKMNALGGWYSEPSRAARRTQKRVANMLARRSEGKPIGTTNLGQFTGRDEGRGSYTATTAPAPAGVTTSSGMHGGRHYMRGGRVGYNKGGRVGILSIL